ncbi:MAG: DUF934 domain-containing protein [Gammaproteobacteria bacterium]
MDNFEFSENTIGASEWYELAREGGCDELNPGVLVVAANSALEFLAGPLNRFERIVVTSGDFNDGRFFSIGRQIRLLGYSGRLTVVGNVLPDQYTALRSCGFDDALICEDSAIDGIVVLDQALALAGVEYPVPRNLEYHTEAGNSQ